MMQFDMNNTALKKKVSLSQWQLRSRFTFALDAVSCYFVALRIDMHGWSCIIELHVLLANVPGAPNDLHAFL